MRPDQARVLHRCGAQQLALGRAMNDQACIRQRCHPSNIVCARRTTAATRASSAAASSVHLFLLCATPVALLFKAGVPPASCPCRTRRLVPHVLLQGELSPVATQPQKQLARHWLGLIGWHHTAAARQQVSSDSCRRLTLLLVLLLLLCCRC